MRLLRRRATPATFVLDYGGEKTVIKGVYPGDTIDLELRLSADDGSMSATIHPKLHRTQ